MRKSTIENLKACQPREQNMQLSFDKCCSFPAQNSAFSLGQKRLMSGKLSRLKSKHTRKNRHASGLNENGKSSSSVAYEWNRSKSFICHWWRAKPKTFGFEKNFFGTSRPFVFFYHFHLSATQYCELLFTIYLCLFRILGRSDSLDLIRSSGLSMPHVHAAFHALRLVLRPFLEFIVGTRTFKAT